MYGAQLPPRYRPLPLPLPLPVVKREPLWLPAAKREPDLYPVFDVGQEIRMYATGLAIVAGVMIVLYVVAAALTPEHRLFVRLIKAEDLDVCEAARDQCPLFELAVDIDMILEEGLLRLEPVVHVGGGGHTLRVSYRGVVLAWGAVPRFTIRHSLLGRRADGRLVLREDMRKLIRAERRALGRVEFEADEVSRGWAATSIANSTLEGLPPCLVQKKSN